MLDRTIGYAKRMIPLTAWAGIVLSTQSTHAQSAADGAQQATPSQPRVERLAQSPQTPQSSAVRLLPQTPQSSKEMPLPSEAPPTPPRPPVPPQPAGATAPPVPGSFAELVPGAMEFAGSPANVGAGAPPQPSAAAAGAPSLGGFASARTAGLFGLGSGATTAIADNANYIDTAIIRSRVRFRFDAAYNNNSPDKAEFFYAKCGCFGPKLHGYGPQHPMYGPLAPAIWKYPGDPRIDYQEYATYVEYAPFLKFSGFIEIPVRAINPTLVNNIYGFSDINAGFKYAFVAEPNRYYTFQLRTYAPTGASDLGLGTNHTTLEPAFLVFQRLSERLYFSGEFRDWIPIRGSNFAGNVLRYGVGLAYNIVLTDHFRIAPVNEIVGWTILNGAELAPQTTPPFNRQISVDGQTIVNEKIGLRFGIGNYSRAGGGSALNDRHSLAVSFGQSLTGDHWYKEIFRLEYDLWF
jgi:hypothetical protein